MLQESDQIFVSRAETSAMQSLSDYEHHLYTLLAIHIRSSMHTLGYAHDAFILVAYSTAFLLDSLYRFNSTESVLSAQQDVEHREEDNRFRRIADFPGFVGPSLSSVLRDHEHRRYPFHGAPDDIYNITSSQPSLLLNAVPQVASGNTNHLTSPGVESVLGSQESYHLLSPRTDLLRRLDYELLDPQLLDILQSESFWSSQETDASPERRGR